MFCLKVSLRSSTSGFKMLWIDRIALVTFCLFLMVPGLSLAVYGYASTAENPPTWENFELKNFVSADNEYRKSTMKQVLTFTPAGMAAQSIKSQIDYTVFNYVETTQVISGINGWLFYKGDFPEQCLDMRTAESALNQLEAMRVIAAGAGSNLLFSVSPNKSIVYQEMLGARATAFAHCNIQAGHDWRRVAKALKSSLIDHYEAMASNLDSKTLYFKTDTHWNDRGRALSYRQLAQTFDVELPIPPEEGADASTATDLRQMLRLYEPEGYTSLEAYWNTDFRNAAQPGIKDVLIIRDSFYAYSAPLEWLFPQHQAIHIDETTEEMLKRFPKHIIVNSVERAFFYRLLNGKLSWGSSFGKSLIHANQEQAKNCSFPSSQSTTAIRLDTPTANESSLKKTQTSILLPYDQNPCIRISISAQPSTEWELLLPAAGGYYRDGLSISPPNVGQETIELVLPGYGGKTVRLNLRSGDKEIENFTIDTGVLQNLQ